MRNVLALPLIAAALGVSAGWAVAAPDDAKGPPCANITDTDWSYSPDGTTATVTIFLGTASCTSISYTLFVQDSDTETAVQATSTAFGDGIADDTSGPGTDSVTLNATVTDQDGEVCLFATTSRRPQRDLDRAPNTGCVPLIPGGTAGGSGFQ
jgi:hypothetical protein